MNALDITIISVIGFAFIRGLFRGLVRELCSIIGVFVGFYAAYNFHDRVAGWFKYWHLISEEPYQFVIIFSTIFFVVFLSISVLGVVAQYFLKITLLKFSDRTLGAGFGFAKGCLVCAVVLISLATFLSKDEPILMESKLAPYVAVVSENLIKIIPPEYKKQFKKKIDEVKDTWAQMHEKVGFN